MESFCKHIQGWRVVLSTWHKQKSSFRCSLRSFSHPCACCLDPADEKGPPAPLLCLSLPLQTLSKSHSFPLGLLHLKTSMEDWQKILQKGLILSPFFCLIVMRFSLSGMMSQRWSRRLWFPVVFGATLVLLTAVDAGPNQDRRQAQQSSCFGSFDLYFVLDM